ncbi:hypothetical protein RRF57_010496 [Xylaria bambusicola]|uniref:Uncharacterized protein n=1 Tax=Xylaria bambusicola TaxID=326684 RepID=A0AAN7USF6_9PEZI
MGDNGDPPKGVFPYPTKGVVFPEPPWEADFDVIAGKAHGTGSGENQGYDEDGDYEDEDMQDGGDLDDGGTVAKGPDPGSDPDPGTATFGVELEFLVVQCPKVRMDDGETLHITDPHPNELRYTSSKMAKWELEHMEEIRQDAEDFERYHKANGTYDDLYEDGRRAAFAVFEGKIRYQSTTKLTRVLRDRGLVVIKWPEADINSDERYAQNVPINDFSESEDSDDEREFDYPNKSRLGDFSSVYKWVPFVGVNRNTAQALKQWQEDFEQYHTDNNIQMYRTRNSDIQELVKEKCTVRGWPDLSEARLQHLKAILEERIISKRNLYKQLREDLRNEQVDPLHVPVPGLKQQYKAWTVTIDLSVDGNGMTKERYANATTADPWNEYFWFGAEVVSPVLPMRDERSYEAVRVACGALRDALRCHKPMEVSTGLHIHLGHTHGWTLFQAKRFGAFWLLAETIILRLHRRDRDMDAKVSESILSCNFSQARYLFPNTYEMWESNYSCSVTCFVLSMMFTWLTVKYCKWCAKIRGSSRLWRALFSSDEQERQACASTIPANNPPLQRMNCDRELIRNVPLQRLGDVWRKFLQNLWQYGSITELHKGLGESQYCRTGIKWRIRGKNSSTERATQDDEQPGTIEARIMHGTLDADNINNWVIVLERIVHVVRNFSDDEFREFLSEFLSSRSPGRLLALLEVPEEVRQYYVDPKRRDTQDMYWEYPDHDLVDWNQPFMVPGHKATHGSYWD